MIFQAGERYLSVSTEDPKDLHLAGENVMAILTPTPLDHRLLTRATPHFATNDCSQVSTIFDFQMWVNLSQGELLTLVQ
jgi:hypothetical protein